MLVQFVPLAAILIVVPILCVRWWGPPTWSRLLLAFVLPPVVAFGGLMVGLHMCDRGVPVRQWAIPAVAMAGALVCIAPARRRRLVVGILALTAIVSSFHFAEYVHRPEVTGNPDARGVRATPMWHTWLTGIYAAESIPRDLPALEARPAVDSNR